MLEKLFSPRGRVNRLQNLGYETLGFLIVLLAIVIIIVAGNYKIISSGAQIPTPSGIENLILFLVAIAATYSNIIVKIKRLHDINLSGWWLPVFFLFGIPYLVLYFWPGTKDKNRFDEDYKEQESMQHNPSLARADTEVIKDYVDKHTDSNAKAVYTHSKDIDSEVKPTTKLNDEKRLQKSEDTESISKNINNAVKKTFKEEGNDSMSSNVLNNLSEDDVYEKALIETEENKQVKSLWAKALVESDGEEKKAKALYIKMRVNNIIKLQNEISEKAILALSNHEKIEKTKEMVRKHFQQLEDLNFAAMKEYLIEFHSKYGYFASINDNENLFLRHKSEKYTFISLVKPKKLDIYSVKYFEDIEPMSFSR